MRALIFIAAAALATAGCNKADQAGNTANVDETVGAGSIASNDVTAIDAVTGEAANMAADVNYLNSADENLGGNASSTASSNRSAPARRPAPATSSPAPATSNTTATEPATNTAAQ